MAYTTSTKVQNHLNLSSIDNAAAMTDAIDAATAIVEGYTGRKFGEASSTDEEERIFNGMNGPEQCIDDCIEISKVERSTDRYGDSWEEISEGGLDGYFVQPNNYEEKGIPVRILHLRSRNWFEGVGNVRVTAKYIFRDGVPADVAMAATMIAASLYMANRGGSSGNTKSESIGNYSVTYKTEAEKNSIIKVQNILNAYKKFSL